MVASPSHENFDVADTTVTSALTLKKVSVHKSMASSISTVKHSSAEPGMSNTALIGGLPVTSMISAGMLPSLMFSLTEVMVS